MASLLEERKRVKTRLESETDPFNRRVLDGRQMALKRFSNILFSYSNCNAGKMVCTPFFESVTACGRTIIEQTKNAAEAQYKFTNGYENDAIVIYGDTDSLMINFGVKSLDRSIELGREFVRKININFKQPIALEFDKVYSPYLLLNKKRYAGLCYTRAGQNGELECKGIETQRRDTPPLVANIIKCCLQKLLIDRDINEAIEIAKQTINDMFCNRIDVSQFIITKELTRYKYKSKQAHVELLEKMKKRNPGNVPKIGDRIPYVICSAPKGTPVHLKAEDPFYALENGIPIDITYYLECQLSKPLSRIFDPILGNKTESIILSGEHTRVIRKMKHNKGTISSFFIIIETCMGCETPICTNNRNRAICHDCKIKETSIYLQELSLQNQLEENFSRYWIECQRCQGSLHQEVLCTSRDCPTFYIRKKLQVDLELQRTQVQRFGVPIW